MRSPRSILFGFGTLGSLPLLVGCSPATTASTGDTSASYADGEYSATGDYVAPSGQETVIVTLTLTDDTVTAVSVVGDATDATAQGFQSQFASGIAAEVVGVDIDLLDVHRVAGSSLTSGGFNAALAVIKSEAIEN